MKRQHIYKQIALSLLLLVCAAGNNLAWGQETEDKYLKPQTYLDLSSLPTENITVDRSAKAGYEIDQAFDDNDESWWAASGSGPATVTIDFGEPVTILGMNILRSGNPAERATKIEFFESDTGTDDSWTLAHTESKINTTGSGNAPLHINFEKEITTQYLQIKFSKEEDNSFRSAFNEIDFITPTKEENLPTILHKHAKWHDLRKNKNYDDDFDDENQKFDTDVTWRPESVRDRKIQATHTYIDTIYAHRGSTVKLTLPDYLNQKISIESYQRWYSFRTGGTFETQYASEPEAGEERIVDLLTPVVDGFYYRLANGYVGSPLSDWDMNRFGDGICSMSFYIPTEDDFGKMFPNYKTDEAIDNNWYVVACDVSGYTDYTATFDENNTTSKFTDNYYEPTLSHRIVFYIHAVEDEDSWYNKAWKNKESYLEEYEINMPFTRLPDNADKNPIYEMVALSKDARSYVSPTGTKDENVNLQVTLGEINTAGIELITNSLSDTSRVISFDYPVDDTGTGTKHVNEQKDGSTPMAEIIVRNGEKNIARFVLKFTKGTSLMTQSMIKAINDKREGTVTTENNDWNIYTERTPQYMEENYEFLTGLDFNFKSPEEARQGVYYPYPLAWDHCSYAFFDGSTGDYFEGGTFPQWGYYSIMNDYLECAEPGETWGWTGHDKAPGPTETCMEPRVEGEENLYHMFIDASDRPGIIARLPFEKELCPGSELFVSAWVKSAKWNYQTTNAAMLFTFMGVKKTSDNDSIFVPLYRHQTGQIPATYMSSINLPGFDTNSNEWFQLAFSFITDQDIANEYTSFVLQIENNSASTSGGDMYLDDVRVYLKNVEAEVNQLESTCSDARTRLNFSIDWEQLLSRTGEPDLDNEETSDIQFPTTDDNSPYSAIGICFIDKEKYEQLIANDTEVAEAIDEAAVQIGSGIGNNDYKYAAMFYCLNYSKNATYTEYNNTMGYTEGSLAMHNDWFFYTEKETDRKTLTVDFYADIRPYKNYIMMVVPVDPTQDETIEDIRGKLSAQNFTGIDDPCTIKTEIQVTSQSIITVDGEILDPGDEYCEGQIRNFAVQLQAPTGEGGALEPVEETVYFDWFFGTEDEFITDDTELGVSLAEALQGLRNLENGTDIETIEEVKAIQLTDGFTEDMQKLIVREMETSKEGQNARLVLHKENLNIQLLESLNLVVRPIQIELTSVDEKNVKICWEYIPLELKTTGQSPVAHVGFHDVNYPAEPNVRIGLAQIEGAKNDNTALKINLRSVDVIENNGKLSLNKSNTCVYLVGSNDPEVEKLINNPDFKKESLPIGTLYEIQATENGGENNYIRISFDLAGAQTQIENNDFMFDPKEGYEYQLKVYFQEQIDGAQATNLCDGSLTFTMKVVPEYQFWKGGATGNWNNDDNWVRANKEDMNDPTGYQNYTEPHEHKGYVPMRFTNVVIPTEHNQVELYSYTTDGHKVDINTTTGSGVTDASTQYIEYDLMVKSATDDGNGYAYDCEPYYSNTVDQIHFEPKAEMLHAELLDYEKAWVDYKLESNQWHTLASPLQGVVAGDFYTDSEAGSDANNVAGTENQEYFTDIYFEKSKYTPTQPNGYDIANSRISPSVYQRGWKGETNMVSTGKPNDVAVAGNWSAVYNDVAEPYNPGTGFSLKVLNMPTGADADGNAVFRLPKADGSYSYYKNDGTEIAETSKPITRSGNAGKLVSDNLKDNENEADAEIPVQLQANDNSNYYLIGNPFMAHLDAAKFFSENKDVLQQKYWTVTDDVQDVAASDGTTNWASTLDNITIAPLQSFFVQKKGDATETTVKFTAEMQTLAESTSNDGTNTSALILTAQTADGKVSRAAIAYDATAKTTYETSEDAELFLDSNLSDVPTIYTVAGTMATSINRTSELYNIPVGIYGNSTETVTLSVEGLKNFSSAALYDAEKRTETPLREGTTITLPANTSGRYFLRAGAPTANEQIATDAIQIYTLSGNRVMVTSTTPLKDIRVYTISGALVKQAKAGFCSHELYLPEDGIYVISAKSANGATQTAKVAVN